MDATSTHEGRPCSFCMMGTVQNTPLTSSSKAKVRSSVMRSAPSAPTTASMTTRGIS